MKVTLKIFTTKPTAQVIAAVEKANIKYSEFGEYQDDCMPVVTFVLCSGFFLQETMEIVAKELDLPTPGWCLFLADYSV